VFQLLYSHYLHLESKRPGQAQSYMPVIPAIQEIKVQGLNSHPGPPPPNKVRPYLKNKPKAKGLGQLLKW
jgi:hypothetical protein